jgi:hypothetical protein
MRSWRLLRSTALPRYPSIRIPKDLTGLIPEVSQSDEQCGAFNKDSEGLISITGSVDFILSIHGSTESP